MAPNMGVHSSTESYTATDEAQPSVVIVIGLNVLSSYRQQPFVLSLLA